MESPPGNEALPADGDTILPGCDNAFSRQSVFGLFLTLIFCLLTQPPGTLIYVPYATPTLTLAFLRLNPLYCLIETLIIVFFLARSLWLALRDGHRPRLQLIKSDKWYRPPLSLKTKPLTSRLRMTAAALLSFRSGKLATLLATLRAQEELPFSQIAPASPTSAAQSRQGTATGTGPTPGTVPRRRTTNLGGGVDLGTNETTGSVPLGRTTSVEGGADLGTNETPGRTSIISAVGPGVLAHGEFLVDVVALFSVIAVMVKLAFSTLPVTITLSAWSLIVGWLGLHIVLFIFHSGGDDGINSLDPADLIRELSFIEKALRRPTGNIGLAVASFPPLACLIFVLVLDGPSYFPIPVYYTSSFFSISFSCAPIIFWPDSIIRNDTFLWGWSMSSFWEQSLVVLAGVPVVIWMVAMADALAGGHMWDRFERGYLFFVKVLASVMAGGMLTMGVCRSYLGPQVVDLPRSFWSSAANFYLNLWVVAAWLFTIVMSYPVEKTCKPEWLDLLG
ncbi:hypothetical protein QBC39DRAFT_346232 [Podospora conica]|nr:hypothetical protein QBC39DRAFT_346232 [Schizothecium conicum]